MCFCFVLGLVVVILVGVVEVGVWYGLGLLLCVILLYGGCVGL